MGCLMGWKLRVLVVEPDLMQVLICTTEGRCQLLVWKKRPSKPSTAAVDQLFVS